MLVNFWLSDVLRRDYQISFSYRDSLEYTAGMQALICPDFPVIPLALAPLNWPKRHFRSPFKPLSRGIRFGVRSVVRIPAFFYEAWVVFRLIKRLRPDIVHLNNGGYPAARSVRAAAVGARLAGCNTIVMVINNLAEPYRTIERWLDYPFDRWVVRSTTKFVTGSVAAAVRLAAILQLNGSQIQPIHNGIRLGEIQESRDEVLQRLGIPRSYSGLALGVVALMVERKGHAVLIDALEIILRRDKGLSSKLVVLLEGEGDLRDDLERRVRNKKLGDVIRFIGTEKNVANFISAIDALVLPSVDHEDFPNVTLEAMALGKAVIASRLAGIPEQVLDGKTGYLVEPRNPGELATAISKLMDDPELAMQMGRDGRVRFQENFTAELAVDRYLKLYQSMTGQN